VGTFLPRLKRVVKAYNETQSSATGYPPYVLNNPALPPNIIEDVLKRLDKGAEGTNVSAKYHPPLMPGNKVRIAVEALSSDIKQQIKSKSYKASHFATFSKELYTVVRQDKDGFVIVAEKPKLKFLRGECLLVTKINGKQLDDQVADVDEAEEEVAPVAKKQKVPFVQKTRARVAGPLVAL
jgi:hypothetical protein